jgi:CheY-specific phosphatase CheX
MDVAFINPFIAAARLVFDTMVRIPLMSGKPYVRSATRHEPNRAFKIAVVMKLSGSVEGQAVFNISEPVALAMVAGLTGAPAGILDGDARDALGEVASMIAGNAKRDLPAENLNMDIPKVVDPGDIVYPARLPVIAIPFDTTAGRFVLEISFRKSK